MSPPPLLPVFLRLNNVLGDGRFAHTSLNDPSNISDIMMDTLLFIDEKSFKLPKESTILIVKADQPEYPYDHIDRILCRELGLGTPIIDNVDHLDSPPDTVTLLMQLTLIVGVRSVRKEEFIKHIELLQFEDRTAIMTAIQEAISHLETLENKKNQMTGSDAVASSIPFDANHTLHYDLHEVAQACNFCHTKDGLCRRLENTLEETEEALQKTEQHLRKTHLELENTTTELDCLTVKVGLLEENLQEKIGEIRDLELQLISAQEKSDELDRAERKNYALNLQLVDQAELLEKIKNLESDIDEQRYQNQALDHDLAMNLEHKVRADRLSNRIYELESLLSKKQSTIDGLWLELTDLRTIVAVQQANAEKDRLVIDMLEEQYMESTLSYGQMGIKDKVEAPDDSYAAPLPGSLAQEFAGSPDVIDFEIKTEVADTTYIERAPVDWRAWVRFLHDTEFSPSVSSRS